jgi:hypothetical protein
MGRKRSLTTYQKQNRFFLVFFGALMILAVIGVLILINRPVGGYGH